jgi:hypothetical protein
MMLLYSGMFPSGYHNIKIDYNAGYATIPSDLEEACLDYVEYTYNKSDDKSINKASISKAGESTSFITGIPDIIKETIEPYKRFEFYSTQVPISNG